MNRICVQVHALNLALNLVMKQCFSSFLPEKFRPDHFQHQLSQEFVSNLSDF